MLWKRTPEHVSTLLLLQRMVVGSEQELSCAFQLYQVNYFEICTCSPSTIFMLYPLLQGRMGGDYRAQDPAAYVWKPTYRRASMGTSFKCQSVSFSTNPSNRPLIIIGTLAWITAKSVYKHYNPPIDHHVNALWLFLISLYCVGYQQ